MKANNEYEREGGVHVKEAVKGIVMYIAYIDPIVYYHHLVLAQERVLLLCEAPPAKPQSLYSFSGLAQALEV